MTTLMTTFRQALLLGALLAAAPALAQGQHQAQAQVRPADPAAPGAGRTVTGQTRPPAAATTRVVPVPKPMSAADIAKAQKAAEARSKAWDARTKRSMTSICNGC